RAMQPHQTARKLEGTSLDVFHRHHLHFISGIDEPLRRATAKHSIDAAAFELDVPVLPDIRAIAPPPLLDPPWTGADAYRAGNLDFSADFDAAGGVACRGPGVGDDLGETADRCDLHVVAGRFARRHFNRDRRGGRHASAE